MKIDAILVPQGAEYQAVCRGLSRIKGTKPVVIAIPVGSQPSIQYLELLREGCLNDQKYNILLMGLCGSLLPQYVIGDIVLIQECIKESHTSPQLQICDRELTDLIHHQLNQKISLVRALTSQNMIWAAKQKCELGKTYTASVVDMEGSAVLEAISSHNAVAMLRVVSDDCHHNLPDLNSALRNGSLKALPLTQQLLRQPVAAVRLIRGGLKGLQVLEKITNSLFKY